MHKYSEQKTIIQNRLIKMNSYLKRPKSKYSRDVLSNDFKRALSAAVIISTKSSPIENEKSSTEIKNGGVADLEKERDKIQKLLKLQTLLEVARKPTTAIRERHMHFPPSLSVSDSNSPSKSSGKQRKGYDDRFSDWSSSSDEILAKASNSRGKGEKYTREHSKESSSNVSRSRKRSLSTSPTPRGKQHWSVDTPFRETKNSRETSSPIKRLRAFEREEDYKYMPKHGKRLHQSRNIKMRGRERFADDFSHNRSLEDEYRKRGIYSDGDKEKTSSFPLARRSDYSEQSLREERYGREVDRFDTYKACKVEWARQRDSNCGLRGFEINAKDENDNRFEAFSSSKSSPNTTTVGVTNSFPRKEYVSCLYTDARRAYQHTNDKYYERGDIYRRFVDPKSNSNSKNGLRSLREKTVFCLTDSNIFFPSVRYLVGFIQL